VDGFSKRIAFPATAGALAGWLDDDHLVWFGRGPAFHNAPGGLQAVVTDLDGTTLSVVQLRLASPMTDEYLSQHSAVVSHGRLLYRTDRGQTVRTFQLTDGTEGPPRRSDVEDTCPLSLADSGPLLTVQSSEGVALYSDAGPVVVVDPALDAYCVFLVSGALAGEPHGSVFGLSQAPWTWWWREILAGLILAAALVAVLLAVRRRNLHRGATRDGEPRVAPGRREDNDREVSNHPEEN
jgi:hypothetical protein